MMNRRTFVRGALGASVLAVLAAGVPLNMTSCHTALVGAYVIEGHVPADLIKKILAERPVLRGLAVPGMPLGTPGMEDGGPPRPYRVMAFLKDGSSRLYASR